MAKTKINSQQLFLEFISVVFAVLLALFLNNWRENVKLSHALDKVKSSIEQEIVSNDSLLNQSLAYRRQLIQNLRSGNHIIMSQAVKDFEVDIHNDQALERYLTEVLSHTGSTPLNRLEIISNSFGRTLVLDDRNLRMSVKNDTLYFYGVGNIQLRDADISNRSWEIAKATGVLVEMDLELVDALNNCYNLNNSYLETSDKAISMIYQGESGIVPVMEDMAHIEQQILKADSLLLRMLD